MKLPARFALLAAALAACVGAAPNWNTTVSLTEGGGHRLGNPAAKVQLMEFVSYTCPHCAQFEKEADGPMRLAYVAPGRLSIEVRNVIRNPIDLTATVLANCGPKEKFFLNHAAILRSQDKWLKKLQDAGEAQQQRWRTGTHGAKLRAVATDAGFYQIMAQRGYDRLQVDRCLSDEAKARQLAAKSKAGAEQYGVEGTPSFALDGTLLAGTHRWADLQPQIAARL